MLVALATFGLFSSVAYADSVSADFENPPFTLGNVNGQDGWVFTSPTYDVEVDSSGGTTGFGAQSLRISNAVTSGSFGDWVFAKPLTSAAGESAIATESHYEAQFDIASAVPGSEQTDLQVSVSPDDGNGSRMSFLRFEDESDGVHVIFFDVTNPGPLPTVSSFNGTDIATLNRSVPHTVKFVMDFVDGPGNDVVEIWIDGVLAHTGTSWEDYYRFDPEQNGNGNVLFPVDTLIFQARGNGSTSNVPANDGNGFLFDNIELTSSTPVPTPPAFGETNSSSIRIEVANRGTIDNETSADASTGGNWAGGSRGGRGGDGGDIEVDGNGDFNNGGASTGDGGDGGDAAPGGLVNSGNATSNAVSENDANGTEFEFDAGGDMNSSEVVAVINNRLNDDDDACGGCRTDVNNIDNETRARARTGGNDADGSEGGDGDDAGDVEVDGNGDFNNGGASTGSGGDGGDGDIGGTINSGNAEANSAAINLLNRVMVRILRLNSPPVNQ
jgi:hypothetical protein